MRLTSSGNSHPNRQPGCGLTPAAFDKWLHSYAQQDIPISGNRQAAERAFANFDTRDDGKDDLRFESGLHRHYLGDTHDEDLEMVYRWGQQDLACTVRQ